MIVKISTKVVAKAEYNIVSGVPYRTTTTAVIESMSIVCINIKWAEPIGRWRDDVTHCGPGSI